MALNVEAQVFVPFRLDSSTSDAPSPPQQTGPFNQHQQQQQQRRPRNRRTKKKTSPDQLHGGSIDNRTKNKNKNKNKNKSTNTNTNTNELKGKTLKLQRSQKIKNHRIVQEKDNLDPSTIIANTSTRQSNRNRRGKQRNSRSRRRKTLVQKVTVEQGKEDKINESIALDAAFPPLYNSGIDTTNCPYEKYSIERKCTVNGWSSVARDALVNEEKQQWAQQQAHQNELKATATSSLTTLKPLIHSAPRSRSGLGNEHSQHQHVEEPELPTDEAANNTNHYGINTSVKSTSNYHGHSTEHLKLPSITDTATRFDMTKLRDRWWHILKEKRAKDALMEEERARVEQQLFEKNKGKENSSAASTCNRDSDDDDSSDSSSSISSSCRSSSDSSSLGDDMLEYLQHETEILGAFLDSPYPLHQAIISDNEESLSKLLTLKKNPRVRADASVHRKALGLMEDDTATSVARLHATDESLSPLQLAVYLDRPHLVKQLLDASYKYSPALSITYVDEQNRTPLMLAAELGYDGCIKVILSYGAAGTVLSAKDHSDNTALHHACRAGSPASTLRLLLGSSGKSGNNQQQRALLTSKNKHGQTPLHLASEYGHVHQVEAFLAMCGASLLSKVFRMPDSRRQTPLLAAIGSGSTDVVMSILMWRGNRIQPGRQWQPTRTNHGEFSSEALAVPCPLTWAVSKGSIEMVHLLLEFSDPLPAGTADVTSAGTFDLVGALFAAVQSECLDKLEIIRVLIEAGANPCKEAREKERIGAGESTPVTTATLKGDIEVLRVMMDTFKQVRTWARLAIRQDPKLQNQPNTYFDGIEAKEKKEISSALCDALVKSLFLGWKSGCHGDGRRYLGSAIALLKSGAELSPAGFSRLKESIAADKLKAPRSGVFNKEEGLFRFDAVYSHYSEPGVSTLSKDLTRFDRSALNFWSRVLCQFPWVERELDVHCSWMKAELLPRNTLQEKFDGLAEVVLVVEGERFLAHADILSAKSAKLAAAIRFAQMNNLSNNYAGPKELHIDISATNCKFLLQHIYHGSIVFGWASKQSDFVRQVLEVSLVAEEYLLPSLVRECEMRLLSFEPKKCYCWSCCTVVRSSGSHFEKIPATECLYSVIGPSKLLNANSVLDALAVSQQLETFPSVNPSKFWPLLKVPVDSVFSESSVWNNFSTNCLSLVTPFEGVKYASVEILLRDFCYVLKSAPYFSQMAAMLEDCNPRSVGDHHEMQLMLLQVCLEELAASALLSTNQFPTFHMEKLSENSHGRPNKE